MSKKDTYSKLEALGFSTEQLNEIQAMCEAGNADSKVDEQMELIGPDEIVVQLEELEQMKFVDDTHDSQLAYDTHYHGIQRILRKVLPGGEKNKDLRRRIRDEINTFLRNGKSAPSSGPIGADSRMAHNRVALVALRTLREWRREQIEGSSGFWELYERFVLLNDRIRKIPIP